MDSERLGETSEKLGTDSVNSLMVSGTNTKSARTVSIALTDGDLVAGGGRVSDRVVGYEYGGFSWWSTYNLATQVWQPAGSNNWPVPSQTASDGHAFGSYEGAPTVLAFHESANSSHFFKNFVLYVGKSGSTQNGTKGLIPGPSTDVFGVTSLNGGVSFGHPLLIDAKPTQASGFVRWAIDYPVATQEYAPSGIATGRAWVLWRQRGVDGQGNLGAPQWMLQQLALQTSGLIVLNGNVVTVPLPTTAGPPMIAARTDLGSVGVTIAYPSYDNGSDVCPSTGTVSNVSWNTISTTDLSTWTPLQITTDGNWRKCVAGSSTAAGNAFTRNVIRPELKVDPVDGTLWAAVAVGNTSIVGAPTNVRVFKKPVLGGWSLVHSVSQPLTSGLHDQWAPSLAVNHALGNTDFSLGLTWHDTRKDTNSATKNAWENIYADIFNSISSMWSGEARIEQAGLNLPPEIVDDYLGDYDGIAADPNTILSFRAAWGDQRAPGLTQVWSTGFFF